MRLSLRHYTRYTFSEPVFLERHVLRLTPRSTGTQRLLSFELDIQPPPVSRTTQLDLEGDETVATWFEGTTTSLVIKATSVVETLRANPFDYLWEGDSTLPIEYPPTLRAALDPYRHGDVSQQVQAFGQEIAAQVEGDASAFLQALNAALHARYRVIERQYGAPLPAEETLSRGEGSCRDLAVLFMAAASSRGFAARFVSGYHAISGVLEHDLHAWAEIYIPGGGWRGFDPTTGLAVADRHVALASGVSAELAAPISGSYRGSATSHLETSVEISEG